MTRTDKIIRLVAVGFSATELSRLPNDLLDSTYESAKGLMKAKQEEVDRVMAREGKHSIRKKQQVADRQRREKIEADWLRRWKPKPPICTVNTTITDVERKIERSQREMEHNKRLFRETGRRVYADAYNRAKSAVQTFQGYLLHLRKEET